MKNTILILFLSGLLSFSCSVDDKDFLILKSSSLEISMDEKGKINKFTDPESGLNYLSEDTISALMSIRVDSLIVSPVSLKFENELIILTYSNGSEATIKIMQHESHITFELMSLSNSKNVDLIVWGPYSNSINKVIGETIGVVQGEDFALGIQSLNPKTLGGYPWKENDCMPQIDIFEQDDYSDISEQGKRYVLYRVEAAKPTSKGSSLQAYCRNRNYDRVIENWGHERYIAPKFADGGYIGSKIAMFGCKVESVLDYISEIEIIENLPHPLINGEWGKISKNASSAYIIMDFSELDISYAVDITRKAGFKYLYHSGPFLNWGHFDFKKEQFPNGLESMKACVDYAEKEGVNLGLHTLSNFITTNDKYVTPIPDDRLAIVGASIILEDIDLNQTEILVESPDYFNQHNNNHLKTIRIGDELIRYGYVSEEEPWKLLDCQRGAHGTNASTHVKLSEVSKLTDHGYKVFLTNTDLSIEVAENLADIYNKTGLRQISFDGLEGNRSTGMGNYGEIIFTQAWYNKINDDVKSHYIADASRTTHYFWHMYTRMNWGEPWYAGFRESQTEYRLKNQKYFKRNLMPAMLGWFKMTPETSMEDMGWLLARSAAFDAGYAFVTSFDIVESNGNSEKILELIGTWEEARMLDIFSEDQKLRMENIDNEFTLSKLSDTEWELKQVFSNKFKHEKKVRQPGEPLYSTFSFDHQGEEQVINFILNAVSSEISNITLEIDNYKNISIPITMEKGSFIKYEGGSYAIVYDRSWNEIEKVEVNSQDFIVRSGEHLLTVDCKFNKPAENPMLKLEIITHGVAELIDL